MREGVPSPTWDGLAWMAVPVVVVVALLVVGRLGQVRPLLLATGRMVGQLALLGLVLGWLLATRSPWLVLGVGLVMLGASAHAVGNRQSRPSWRVRLEAFACLAGGLLVSMGLASTLALGLEPWYEPAVFVPLMGMVLGNSVNGTALAADRLDSELRSERDRLEWRLSLGATSWQAALPAIKAAVRAALTPTINGMTIAGIVSIPGMATGQLLAGADVGTALRYQVLIYLAVAGTVGLSSLMLLGLRLGRYFTAAHQLRPEAFGRD